MSGCSGILTRGACQDARARCCGLQGRSCRDAAPAATGFKALRLRGTNVLRVVLVLVGTRMLYLFNFETLKTKRSLSQRPSIELSLSFVYSLLLFRGFVGTCSSTRKRLTRHVAERPRTSKIHKTRCRKANVREMQRDLQEEAPGDAEAGRLHDARRALIRYLFSFAIFAIFAFFAFFLNFFARARASLAHREKYRCAQ